VPSPLLFSNGGIPQLSKQKLSKQTGSEAMAIRKEIKSYSIEGLEASYQLDTGMEPGGENYVVIDLENGKRLTRTFYFEEEPRAHCINFVKKIARDERYRARCLNGKTTWAKVGAAYQKHNGAVYGIFSPLRRDLWGDKFQEAKDKARQCCRMLYERFSELFEEIEDPSEESIETVVKQVKTEAEAAAKALKERATTGEGAISITEPMPFGKHEGQSLLEIAQEDPEYAEWAVENLSDRPEIQKGLEKALQAAKRQDE
jgi:NACalpha-BTF3-like transcription factor